MRISAIPNSIAEHKQNITSECENLETGQEYVVPNTTMKLKKGASDAEITAAGLSIIVFLRALHVIYVLFMLFTALQSTVTH